MKYFRVKLPLRLPLYGVGLLLSAFLIACSHSNPPVSGVKDIPGRACKDPDALVEVLTEFSTHVGARNYYKALSLLDKEDQAKMIAADGTISDMTKRQLDALNFQGLANNPQIDMVKGKLTGVFNCLPCLDQGEPIIVEETVPEEKPDLQDPDEKRRKAMAAAFFKNIQNEKWQEVTSAIHPKEREVFLPMDKKGLTELDKNRFRTIEECDLDALNLQDDHLIGIVVLLEPPLSDLWQRSQVFFDAVEADDVEKVLSMMIESEKKHFVDKEGKVRSDRFARLKTLDRHQWRKFYLYHNVLMGVVEASIGYDNL